MSTPLEDSARRAKAAKNSPRLSVGGPRIPTGILARKIVLLLRQNPQRHYTPNEIATEVKDKKSNVRKELNRLLLRGKDDTPAPVIKTGPGFYACHIGPEELAAIEQPEPKVHALQLTWEASDSPLFGGFPPRSPPSVLDAGFGAVRAQGAWAHDESSRSWRVVRFQGPHRITLQAFPTTGTLMASIGSSENPLNGPALAQLRVWLQATFQAEGFRWSDPQVKTVEIHRDFETLRLSGAEAARFYLGRMGLSGTTLRLEALEGALVQVYNKRDFLRMEVRLRPRSLDLQSLEGLLVGFYYGPPDDLGGSNGSPGLPHPEGGYA